MASPQSQTENLKLTFRVDGSAAKRSPARAAWLIWCLLGVAMGISGWVLGRHLLTDHLGATISEAEDRDEALLALAGLSILGDDAIEPVTRALVHQDAQVARAAYRLLDQRISIWQSSPENSATKFKALSTLLLNLPNDVLPDRLAPASNLATRMQLFCETSENAVLTETTQLCDQIVQRSLQSQYTPITALTLADQNAVPTDQITQPLQMPASNSSSAGLPVAGQVESSLSLTDVDSPDNQFTDTSGVMVSMRDPSGDGVPPPLRSLDDARHSSTGSPMASVQLVPRSAMNSNINEVDSQTRRVEETAASYSLSGQPADRWSPPVAVRLQNTPIQRVVSRDDVELAAIPDLPVEHLVRLLGSTAPQVAQTAALALRNNNMSESSLALASELATCSSARKLELTQEIARRDDLSPRPWLLWMAEDSDPSVRRQAVSLLSAMVDKPTRRQLYSLLTAESDPDVALTIRQVLAQAPGLQLR